MKLSLPSFARWRSGALEAVTRFPWNILCGVAGAACGIVALHAQKDSRLIAETGHIVMTVALGMPLFFALRMLRERTAALMRWPFELIGVPLLAAWYFTVPQSAFNAPSIYTIRWLLLLAALHFFAAVAAYLRSADKLGFWQFNRRLFLRFALATLYTGVLTVGLELALLSADKLFELHLNHAYDDLWFIMTGIFHPAFFLGGVPNDFNALAEDDAYPRGLKAFTQFALAPLVAVYTAILYAYALKIILMRSWPHGWVALPVLLLSGIGILTFLLLYPLRDRLGEKWGTWFCRNFPRALGPLSILLLLSVFVRIRAYGVTEERYLGIVLGVWVLAWSLCFVVKPSGGIRWVPASLGVIAFLAAYGPWSAGAISRVSQLNRLKRMLQLHRLWESDHAARAGGNGFLKPEDYNNLRATIDYLVRVHGGQSVRRLFEPVVLAVDWNNRSSWQTVHDVLDQLGVETHDVDTSFIIRRKENTFVSAEDFRRVAHGHLYIGGHIDWAPTKFNDVSLGLDWGVLKVATDQDPDKSEVPMSEIFARSGDQRNFEAPEEGVTVDFAHGDRQFRLIFDAINSRREKDGPRINTCDFFLLEK